MIQLFNVSSNFLHLKLIQQCNIKKLNFMKRHFRQLHMNVPKRPNKLLKISRWTYHFFRFLSLILDISDLREKFLDGFLRFQQSLLSILTDVCLTTNDVSHIPVQFPTNNSAIAKIFHNRFRLQYVKMCKEIDLCDVVLVVTEILTLVSMILLQWKLLVVSGSSF